MTSDRAIEIAARLESAIWTLEAARLLTTIEDGDIEAQIGMALQRARRGLAEINVLLACEEHARTIERQIIDKANRR